MAINRFFTPSVVVKNISQKAVRLINRVTINPGQTVDLYEALNVPVELFEDQIIKNLEKPYGDLYVEQEIKGTIQILNLSLISFFYGIVGPSNINAINAPFPGAQLAFASDEQFSWINPITVTPPLLISGDNVISIPPAGAGADGYLTKEDWARFNASVKGAIRIWQYQDFAASVSSSVTLSAFQNGSGVAFNASYIIDDTAAVVLTSDSSQPPTTTLSFPARLLPANRVVVTSHIGTTVVFNSAPESTLNVRVFYLISLPATVALPNDYQEDPEFLNDSSLDYLDDLYVNQNQTESVYGVKTWEDDAIFNDGVRITTGAVDGYVLTSDSSGNATWQQPTGGTGTGDVTNAANIGTDGYGVFAQKSGTILQFKNVAADSDKINVREDSNFNIRVDANVDSIARDINLDGYFFLSNDEIVTGHTTFDPTVSTDPAFTIVPDGYAPTTNVADGGVSIVGGILYAYDATRSKWLSVDRQRLHGARNSSVGNTYLLIDENVPANLTGYRMVRNGTIVSIWAQTRNVETWTFEIRRNGVTTPITSLSLTATEGDSDDTINVDFDVGDRLQLYASGTGISRPTAGIEIAWRV